jgi:hypothetical protein
VSGGCGRKNPAQEPVAPVYPTPQNHKKAQGEQDVVHSSTMVNATVPRDVPTTLSFISPTSNFNIRYIAPSAEVNTGVYEEHKVVIKDARPNRSSFTLDTGGFVLADHKSNVEAYSIYIC